MLPSFITSNLDTPLAVRELLAAIRSCQDELDQARRLQQEAEQRVLTANLILAEKGVELEQLLTGLQESESYRGEWEDWGRQEAEAETDTRTAWEEVPEPKTAA